MRSILCFVVLLITFTATCQERISMIYEDTLGMDLFLPRSPSTDRPLLIYVHGGGFSGGTRDSERNIEFCQYFAERGWATATVSYHLTRKGKGFGCDVTSGDKIATFKESARNIHQAVKYLLALQMDYRLDTSRVVIAGSSAGAEAVMQAAYWQDTKKGILPADFSYAGVISMAGAILDPGWISKESAIPTQLFHGTCDGLVPYGNAPHHYCSAEKPGFLMLYGAQAIAKRLDELHEPYHLVTDCGGGHEWASKPMRPDYIYMIEDFLENDVLNQQHRQISLTLSEGNNTCKDRSLTCE